MVISDKNRVYEIVPVNEDIKDKGETYVRPYGYGIRHIQIIILFTCMHVGFIARAHLGVSIVAMTRVIAHNQNTALNRTLFDINGTNFNSHNAVDLNGTNSRYVINATNFGFVNTTNEDTIWNVYRTYDWSKPIQDMILGAFFVGYCVAMFPTGMLCQRFGGKLPLQICLLINGIVSIASPSVAAWGGWKAVYCCRVLQGASQAGLYPGCHSLLAKWVPISEKATLSSFVYTGTLLGTVIAFQIGGLLASSAAGWPGTFWLTGALCIGSFLILTLFGAASPDLHKTVTEDEKNYILGKIEETTNKKVTAKTPWKRIITSKPLWSTFFIHTCAATCFVFLFTQLPSYMHYVLGFDVKNSGLLSSLPYIASAATNLGFGVLSDFCINRGYLSTRNTRIMINSVAHWGPAVCLILISLTYNSGLAVVLFIMALGLFSGLHSGWMINYIDLSPNFSGTLMATGNTFYTTCVLFLPLLMSNIVTDVYDRYQWRNVLFIMAGLISVSNAFFAIFMSAERQPWDQIDEKEDIKTEKANESN